MEDCVKPELNLNPGRIITLYDEHLPKWDGATSIDMAQRTDLRTYMLEDILVKVDRMSMMHSLEVRSPFLDYRMVELGLKIPSRLRVKNGINKYLLRRLAARHLPEVVYRAPKRGFGIPVNSWMNDDLIARTLQTTLTWNDDRHPDPFVKGGTDRLWHFSRENPYLDSAMISVLAYRWWCQSHAVV